jgi:Domain of unknown function (DUF5666)
MKRILMLATLTGLSLVCSVLQGQPQGRGGGRNFPPGESMLGKVTSASKDSLVVAPLAGGDAVTVKVSDITRLMKDRQPIKLTDIKTNDVVFVRGHLSGGTMAAAMVGIVNPEMVQRIQPGGRMGRGNGGGESAGGFNRDDLGKKYIAGEVKAINETRMTVARVDGQNQDIEVDENTSFKRGNESITLPDIHLGDFVRGPGELKDNIFIAKELAVGRPMRMRTGDSGGGSQQNPPGNSSADKPLTPAPPKN